MTTPRDNSLPDPGQPDHASLDAVESSRAALGSLGAMQRDRAALRAALAAELHRPLSAAQAAVVRSAIDAAMREASDRGELDRGVLAALGDGVELPPDPSRRVVHRARPGVLATIGPWVFSRRALAGAAAVALLSGVFYLASMSPGTRGPAVESIAPSARSSGVPSWAVLPDRPVAPPRAKPVTEIAASPAPVRVADVRETRDAALAMRWLREGRLAIRLTTDAPRRDGEKLDAMVAEAKAASVWALAPADGREAVVPARPWPIDTRMADADGRGVMPARQNARVGAFDLAVRPTAEALVSAQESLERATRGGVVFERVDGLGAEGVRLEALTPSAAGVLWWTKPAEQWTRRVRVPLVVEFGTPSKR